MEPVRVVFPTAWDRKQLAASPELLAGVDLQWCGPDDADCPAEFDVLGFIDGAAADRRTGTAGVFSSSDYPGAAVAAAISSALGLPGSRPQAIMRAAHKGLSRRAQSECVPEATPCFQVLDPDRLELDSLAVGFPCFVKPVKGCYSVLARRIEDRDQLRAFLTCPAVATYRGEYLGLYHRMVARYLGPDVDGAAFIAEELIVGRLVTVEGYCTGDTAVALGVVDSVRDPRTGSFVAFEYPSALPPTVQARMEDIAQRLALHLGLRWTLWNVELMWDAATDRIRIVEINPRMCGQFADLYQKVDGTHGYRIALDLCRGRDPVVRRRAGRFPWAASHPLRIFEPAVAARVPDADDVAAAQAMFPGTLVWNEVRGGDRLDDFETMDDGHSYRYAVVNLGAPTREALAARRDAVLERLGYRWQRPGAGSC